MQIELIKYVIVVAVGSVSTVASQRLRHVIIAAGSNRLLKADSHIACCAHAAPMPFPCHAVPLRV